jgi:hypothetical protein
MVALLKAGLTVLKKIAKFYLKKKMKEKGADIEKKVTKYAIIVAVSFVFLSVALIYSTMSSFICSIPFVKCDAEKEKSYEVITFEDRKKISERIDKLRNEANDKADVKGVVFGSYRLNDSYTENGKTDREEEKESIKEGLENVQSGVTADPAIYITGKKEGINQGFLNRLAGTTKVLNKSSLNIVSGYRSIEKQKELYYGWTHHLPGYNLAAKPGGSRHNYGFAADVDGWMKFDYSSAQLETYGLYKAVPSENWHIEPVETKGVAITDLGSVSVDGSVGSAGGSGSGEIVSESLVYLMAFSQIDEWNLSYNKKKLEKELKKGTNLGKTYALAKALMDGKHNISDYPEVKERSKKEKWKLMQYMRWSRWEIQKCYLVGDQKVGFWEKLFGGPTPCKSMDKLTGMKIVPDKLRGVVGQVTETSQCTKKDKKGQCTSSKKTKAVKYQNPKEFLKQYLDISLFSSKLREDYEKNINMIIKELYEKSFNIESYSESYPDYIPPLESGTYSLLKDYGEKDGDKTLSGVMLQTSMKNALVYASGGGTVVLSDKKSGTVILQHSGGYYTQYDNLKEIYVDVKKNVSQAQLIGSFGSEKPMKFTLCSSLGGNSVLKSCGKSINPADNPAYLDFQKKEDKSIIKEREKDYEKMKKKALKGEVVYMPGYSSASGLGSLSAKYETGEKKPGERAGVCVASKGDSGGLSCGSYQIANGPGTLKEFVDYLKKNKPNFASFLANVPRTLSAFGPAWKKAYDSDPQGFYQAQHDFIGATHYQPVVNRLEKELGLKLDGYNAVIKDVVWSTAVHHGKGGAFSVFKNAGVKPSDTEEQIINKVYAERSKVNVYFARNSAKIKQSLITRFKNEKADALARLK